jgi:hypothetical protein
MHGSTGSETLSLSRHIAHLATVLRDLKSFSDDILYFRAYPSGPTLLIPTRFVVPKFKKLAAMDEPRESTLWSLILQLKGTINRIQCSIEKADAARAADAARTASQVPGIAPAGLRGPLKQQPQRMQRLQRLQPKLPRNCPS